MMHHKGLTPDGLFTFDEQMANVGSDVERALTKEVWKKYFLQFAMAARKSR